MKKLLLGIIYCFFLCKSAFALIEVDITRGNLDPLPIAVSPLHVDKKSEKIKPLETNKLGEEISKLSLIHI